MPFVRRYWQFAVAAALVAVLIWAVIAQSTVASRDARIATISMQLAKAKRATSVTEGQLDSMTAEYEEAKPYQDNDQKLQEAAKAAADKAGADEAKAQADEKKAKTDEATAKRDQAKADSALKTVAASTLEDGYEYSAPATMHPGTYRTTTANGSCYWEVLNGGSDSQDIAANDVGVSGNITVTVNSGQTFDSHDCGDWVKIG